MVFTSRKKDWRKGPIAWMARNSIAAHLLMFILLGGGIWTAMNMQKEVDPQFELDIVEVSVSYPGAAPSEVEQGILLPVEEAARGVSGIKEIRSRAWEGSGRVTFELVAGVDRIKAYQDIDQAVAQIRTFPDDAEKPDQDEDDRKRQEPRSSSLGNLEAKVSAKQIERAMRKVHVAHQSEDQGETRRHEEVERA